MKKINKKQKAPHPLEILTKIQLTALTTLISASWL